MVNVMEDDIVKRSDECLAAIVGSLADEKAASISSTRSLSLRDRAQKAHAATALFKGYPCFHEACSIKDALSKDNNNTYNGEHAPRLRTRYQPEIARFDVTCKF